MRLLEAQEAIKQSPAPESPVLDVQLACGITPLHFSTFLQAHLRQDFPSHRIAINSGVFGDLPGNLERLGSVVNSFVVALIEWQDLDPRLGIRSLGGWSPRQLPEIIRTVRDQAARISAALESLSSKNRVAVSFPTLTLPPISFTPGFLFSRFECDLRSIMASFSSRLSEFPEIRQVNSQHIDQISPLSSRLDVKSEFNTGFPYSLTHADKLADLIAKLLREQLPKKGLITDLDDTFWLGILGEVNPEGVSWDLDHHAQKHGLYQQFLSSLAESGTLIAVASKNDPALIEEAFRVRKPLLARDKIFPLEANWGPKSASVKKILEIWNVGADSVVFVDDSAMDLAEVGSACPGIECVLFPKEDDKATLQLLYNLRNQFGKTSISAEDEIRLGSIRSSRAVAQVTQSAGYTPERFLREAEGKITISFTKVPPDPRVLELINKTNQFNLNGKRHTDSSWRQYLNDPDTFLMVASYEDRFGPLGKIAVVAGQSQAGTLNIHQWVMSCRAFSRRIEHGCLLSLFQKFDAQEAIFDFATTPRNGPTQEFFAQLLGKAPQAIFSLSRQQFVKNSPVIFLHIQESSGE
jgi:FkbH-like protein